MPRNLNMSAFWIHMGVLNMPGLHRVLIMPEYAWIIPGYAWMCLNQSQWLEVFNFVKCFRLNIFASKISNLLYLWGLRGLRRARGRESYSNNDIPIKYSCDTFLMICLSILVLFFTFWYFKGVNQRFTKAVILQFCKTARESSRWYK